MCYNFLRSFCKILEKLKSSSYAILLYVRVHFVDKIMTGLLEKNHRKIA